MKKILLGTLLMAVSYTLVGQSKIKQINPTKIKIKTTTKELIRGLVYKVEEENIFILPSLKAVRNSLLRQDCKKCTPIPISNIRQLKVGKNRFPYGTTVGAGLGLTMFLTASKSPNPDGPSKKDIAALSGLMTTLGGVLVDLVMSGLSERKVNEKEIEKLKGSSIQNQFHLVQQEQLAMLLNKQSSKKFYTKKIEIYTKEGKVWRGQFMGQQEQYLLLQPNKESSFNKKEEEVQKIAIADVYYYEFE